MPQDTVHKGYSVVVFSFALTLLVACGGKDIRERPLLALLPAPEAFYEDVAAQVLAAAAQYQWTAEIHYLSAFPEGFAPELKKRLSDADNRPAALLVLGRETPDLIRAITAAYEVGVPSFTGVHRLSKGPVVGHVGELSREAGQETIQNVIASIKADTRIAVLETEELADVHGRISGFMGPLSESQNAWVSDRLLLQDSVEEAGAFLEGYLRKYNEVGILLTTAESGTLAAMDAVAANSLSEKIRIVGFGGSGALLERLRGNSVNDPKVTLIREYPARIAEQMVVMADMYLNKPAIPPEVHIEVDVGTEIRQ